MLTPAEIVAAASRKWPAVLRAEGSGENLFPLQIPFGQPRTTDDFDVLQRQIQALASASMPWTIDWEEVATRKWGRQRIPMRVVFDSADALADALKKSRELRELRTAIRLARETCPALAPWLRTRADRIVDHLDDWPSLVAVCQYFHANPQPGCHPRQIPVPVGTKFIEEHLGILRELLDVVVGDRANQCGETFYDRFHLLVEPAQVRFRFLDSQLREQVGWPVLDCAVPAPSFADLSWKIGRVLVVENRNVFLCLPDIPETLAIFGAGKAATLLHGCAWMRSADIVYWGDCDDAGFGILSRLRSEFAHVRSVLMDGQSWLQWKTLAIPGKRDLSASHHHLTSSERAAHEALLSGPWMLEQERIPSADAHDAVIRSLTGE